MYFFSSVLHVFFLLLLLLSFNCTRSQIPCQLFHSIDEAFERLNEIVLLMKRILHNLCPLQLILSFAFFFFLIRSTNTKKNTEERFEIWHFKRKARRKREREESRGGFFFQGKREYLCHWPDRWHRYEQMLLEICCAIELSSNLSHWHYCWDIIHQIEYRS